MTCWTDSQRVLEIDMSGFFILFPDMGRHLLDRRGWLGVYVNWAVR
jgi:hypothetical protein